MITKSFMKRVLTLVFLAQALAAYGAKSAFQSQYLAVELAPNRGESGRGHGLIIDTEASRRGLALKSFLFPSAPRQPYPVVCDASSEPRGKLERRGAGRTARLETLPVHDVLHVLNAQHDRDTLIEEFRAVGGTRIMA